MKVIYRKLGREKAWGQAHCGENKIEIDPCCVVSTSLKY